MSESFSDVDDAFDLFFPISRLNSVYLSKKRSSGTESCRQHSEALRGESAHQGSSMASTCSCAEGIEVRHTISPSREQYGFHVQLCCCWAGRS